MAKRYSVTVAGRNLGVIMRAMFGIGTPRTLQRVVAAVFRALRSLLGLIARLFSLFSRLRRQESKIRPTEAPIPALAA